MKKRIIDTVKKRWLLILIAADLVFALSIFGYAEYHSENSYMKRVVVSTTDQGMLFSSNYLVEGGTKTYQTKYETNRGIDSYDVSVYLWNYSLKNTSICYPDEIDYTLELRVTDNKGTPITNTGVFADIDDEHSENNVYRAITVKKQDGTVIKRFDNTSDLLSAVTVSDSIAAGNGAAKQTLYTVTFENWDLDKNKNICLQMIARPDRVKNKELRDIAAVIGLKEIADDTDNDWRASISEIQNNRSDADGYNLVLTGSGKATIIIKWDTTKIDINKFIREGDTIYSFYEGEREVGDIDGNNLCTMTLNADANTFRNRYNIQLYLCSGVKPSEGFFAKEGTDEADNAWITYSITSIS